MRIYDRMITHLKNSSAYIYISNMGYKIAAMPLEVGKGGGSFGIATVAPTGELFNLYLFSRAFSHKKVVVPSLKIAINLPRTYKKLHFKGEPYRISG